MEVAGASIGGQTCCVYVGSGGSGHFVKTVHNGVEYSIMQLLAETISLVRDTTGSTAPELARALQAWNNTTLQSYIVQVAIDVLTHIDHATGSAFVDIIADQAIQNSSGSRAAQNALALGSPATTFAESSLAWYLSCDQEQRSRAKRYSSFATAETSAGCS